MFIISGKGDYNLLSQYSENSFSEYELYLKTVEDCDFNKFSALPKHIKIISVHQPNYVKLKDGSLKLFDITSTDEVGAASLEALKKTVEFVRKCNIPKLVVHESCYNASKNDQDEKLKLLKTRLEPYISEDFKICFENGVLWCNSYYPKKSLLTSVEDFEKLLNLFENKVSITLDVEHLNITILFKNFLKQTNYYENKIISEQFVKDFKKFAKENQEKLQETFKKEFERFVSKFYKHIKHIHLNGSDFTNFVYDPETKLPLIGEHLPIKYKTENVRDKFDYNFIFNILNKFLYNENINVVLELGIRNKDYNFHDEMINSLNILSQFNKFPEWDYEKLSDDLPSPKDLGDTYSNWQFPKIIPNEFTKYHYIVKGYDPEKPKKLKIGYRADISSLNVLFAHYGITIEPYVKIGPFCSIMSYSTIDNKKGKIVLKRNSRIGAHSTIMPGVTIGENSIVAAYSFVNKNVSSNVIVAGIPAKIIGDLK